MRQVIDLTTVETQKGRGAKLRALEAKYFC